MRNSITIRGPEGPVSTTIALPRSKSVANRALILASLAGDVGAVEDPGEAEDTRTLLQLLSERPRMMHCGSGGTTFRFLLAWAAVQEGEEHVITGDARLLERPHDELADALLVLGADIERVAEGYLVRGKRMKGGRVRLDSPMSSQYLSALLLVAPCFERGLHLRWTGTRLSAPYVRMTLRMLERSGIDHRMDGDAIHVVPGPYRLAPLTVPADWSSASFWFEVAALGRDAEVRLAGVHVDTLQGDSEAVHFWSPWVGGRMTEGGLLIAHRKDAGTWPDEPVDLADAPDLFQPLAFTCAALGIPAWFKGLHNLPLKETDRILAVAEALAELGCTIHHGGGSFTVEGRVTSGTLPPFDPRGDHRMAMSLAPLALVCEAITILDPEVVGKSYPGYWDDLRKAGFRIERS